MNIFIAGYENLTQNYRKTLESLGAETACPDFGSFSFPSPELLALYFDGLLLPGGGDIYPGLFGQENQGSFQIDLPLDQFQLSVFYAFCQAKRPILGICKGMQLINVALGGTLLQDLPAPLKQAHARKGKDQIHPTTILPGTFLYALYQEHLNTNSAHHQAVDRLGTCLLPAQYSQDQVLEGFFHASLPVIAVQWHPERMEKDQTTGDGSLVLRYFLSLCSSKQPSPYRAD